MSAKEKEANGGAEMPATEEETGNSQVRKYVWIVILLAVVGGFIGHISIQLQNYLRFRKLEIEDQTKVQFILPEPILCPPEYFWNERVEKYKWNNGTINYRDEIFAISVRNAFFAIVNGTLNVSHFSDKDYEMNLNLAKLTFLPTLARTEIGNTIPDVMIFCEFGRHSCDIRNFSTFLHHNYGVCMRFHERPDTLQRYGVGSRNGLIAAFRVSKKGKRFDFERRYLFIKKSYKIFMQRKQTWPNTEKVLHSGSDFVRSFFGVKHSRLTRLDTMTSPCRPDSRRRLCYLERAIGLTCKQFLIDAHALMQMYAQNNLVTECKCISYEWALTEEQTKYPSCQSLPHDVIFNAGISMDNNGTFIVTLANMTKVKLDQLMDVSAARKTLQCYHEAKAKFQKVRFDESQQSKKEKLWTPLCKQERYTFEIQTQQNPMKSGIPYQFNKEVFLLNWGKQMKALKESGINQTCVFEDRVKELVAKSLSYGNNTSAAYREDNQLRAYNFNAHQFLVFPTVLTATARKEIYEYPSGQFFADVGGLSGVWIGLCVLSIFGLIESAIKSMRSYFAKK